MLQKQVRFEFLFWLEDISFNEEKNNFEVKNYVSISIVHRGNKFF